MTHLLLTGKFSGIGHKNLENDTEGNKSLKVSAVLPLYNGIKYLRECVESIRAQTLADWKLIIVCEYGNTDGSVELAHELSRNDGRIIVIENFKRLGLAQSLNVGLAAACSKYIACVDVDDPSYPERFDRQAAFLDENPDVLMCGTLTRSVLPSDSYDLWTRIMFAEKIVNLSEVLCDHRWGFDNISLEKGVLHENVREIISSTLRRNFGIIISDEEKILPSSWRNKQIERYITFLIQWRERYGRCWKRNIEDSIMSSNDKKFVCPLLWR